MTETTGGSQPVVPAAVEPKADPQPEKPSLPPPDETLIETITEGVDDPFEAVVIQQVPVNAQEQEPEHA